MEEVEQDCESIELKIQTESDEVDQRLQANVS
jgi:hypothetical protein